jgi:hypothetical protein
MYLNIHTHTHTNMSSFLHGRTIHSFNVTHHAYSMLRTAPGARDTMVCKADKVLSLWKDIRLVSK